MMDYYLNLSKNEEIQYMQRIIKNILVFYYLWDLFYLWNGMYELSLNLSRNQKMKGKVKMEFALITNVKYCIKVYQLL
jgi:hypothetical protein